MSSRKIAECLNVRINVGNYQHIELTKYAEEQIEYSSEAERKEKEDALRNDLVESLLRSMKVIPERLNKGVEAAQEVEEAIQKSIPEWLANGPIPNIANGAAQINLSNAAEQKDNKDKNAEILSEVTQNVEVETNSSENPTCDEEVAEVAEVAKIIDDALSDEELFEDDDMPEPATTKIEIKADKKADNTDNTVDELDDMFDDEDADLFGDE